MIQTLDCIIYARSHKKEYNRIMDCLSQEKPSEIVINRSRLSFNPISERVTIDRASADDPFSCKIIPCSMAYEGLEQLLRGEFENVKGFEWA